MSDAIREQIVKVAKLMYEKGMVNAFAETFPFGRQQCLHYTQRYMQRFLKEDMIVKTDMNGNILEGMYKPSSEIKLHLEAYKKRKVYIPWCMPILLIPLRTRLPTNLLNQKPCAEMVIFLERYLLQHTVPRRQMKYLAVSKNILMSTMLSFLPITE